MQQILEEWCHSISSYLSQIHTTTASIWPSKLAEPHKHRPKALTAVLPTTEHTYTYI